MHSIVASPHYHGRIKPLRSIRRYLSLVPKIPLDWHLSYRDDFRFMTICYLALGSNIHPQANLQQAIDQLASLPNFQLETISPCYETEPWGVTDQAAFLNLVLQGYWQGNVYTLLQAVQCIEATLNRVRVVKNGPRTIDVDILLFGDEQHRSAQLTIPHPGLFERDFMLLPLLDISPNEIDPVRGMPLRYYQQNLTYRCIRQQLKEHRPG